MVFCGLYQNLVTSTGPTTYSRAFWAVPAPAVLVEALLQADEHAIKVCTEGGGTKPRPGGTNAASHIRSVQRAREYRFPLCISLFVSGANRVACACVMDCAHVWLNPSRLYQEHAGYHPSGFAPSTHRPRTIRTLKFWKSLNRALHVLRTGIGRRAAS